MVLKHRSILFMYSTTRRVNTRRVCLSVSRSFYFGTNVKFSRVRNRGVRVGDNLLMSLFHSAWAGEGERKNNSKFTDPNYPISDSANELY